MQIVCRGYMQCSSEKLIEEIMFRYLELCVDLKKSHVAKEGLFQYRNMCQVNPHTIKELDRVWKCLISWRHLNGDIYRARTWRAWRRWCKATSPWRRRRRRPPSRRPLTRFLSFLMISSHCIENRIPTILSFHHDPRFNRFK